MAKMRRVKQLERMVRSEYATTCRPATPVHKRPKPVCDNLAASEIRDSWDESSCSATVSSWGHNSLDASVSISKSPGTLRFLQLSMWAGPGELWAPWSCARVGGRPAVLRSSARPCQRGLTPEAKRADICQQGHQLTMMTEGSKAQILPVAGWWGVLEHRSFMPYPVTFETGVSKCSRLCYMFWALGSNQRANWTDIHWKELLKLTLNIGTQDSKNRRDDRNCSMLLSEVHASLHKMPRGQRDGPLSV